MSNLLGTLLLQNQCISCLKMGWQVCAGSVTRFSMVFPKVHEAFLQQRKGTWRERSLLASRNLCCSGKRREGRKGFNLVLMGTCLVVAHGLLIFMQ